jgi:hypothetical protein
MSWLSAAWNRNKKAIGSYGLALVTGGPVAVAGMVTKDAVGEAQRVIARSDAPPEAKAVMTANAVNGINAAGAAFGVNQPSVLNPLGAQGSQLVAIGGKTVSVNTLALVGLAVVALVLVFFVSRRKR